ncbi:DUF6188 family protein [Cnuibacter sp. UC19_7]|uniref:DUF6188 family protein n=1 Tax=Cnuibacter sp. UC19_7 TaxID=3350166 RepID=UPI0036727ED2
MYGVPADVSFAFFEGRRLDAVLYGRHQLSLLFDGEVSLNIEGDVGVVAAGAGEVVVTDSREVARPILDLLSLIVAAVRVDPPTSLILVFDDGTEVRAIDDRGPYECFNVHHGQSLWIM